MSEQLIKDTLKSTGKIFDNIFEYPVEQEILLADYDEQIFKIIKTTVDFTETQKFITNDKLTLEGFFKITVYYQPPHIAHITTISKKLPFQKQFDLADVALQPNFIVVGGELQYINTRAVNSQRIDIRGVYGIHVRIYSCKQTDLTTALDGDNLCFDSEEINHFYLTGRGNRQFSVEDDLNFGADFEKIIDITAHNNNMSLSAFTDKVNVKGEILADIAYLKKDDPTVQHQLKTFIYNQVVDVKGAMENSIPFADFTVVNFTVTQNQDTKGIRCIVTSHIDVKSFAKSSVIGVTDAFSKIYDCEKENDTIIFDENISSVHRSFQLSVEDNVPEGYIISHSIANMGPVTVDTVDGRDYIKSKLTVSIIAQNVQNELECFIKTQDVEIDLGENIYNSNEYILTSEVNSISSSIVGDLLKAQISINVTGFVIKKKGIKLLKDFVELTEKTVENNNEYLVLYYAKKDEKVFDIAMKYKTDVLQITNDNGIDGKTLDEDKMLFISTFRI